MARSARSGERNSGTPASRTVSVNSGASGVSSPKSEKAIGFSDASMTGRSCFARTICSAGEPGMKAQMSAPIARIVEQRARAVLPKTSGWAMPMVVMSSGLSIAA